MSSDIVGARPLWPGRAAATTGAWPGPGEATQAQGGEQAVADRNGAITALYQAHALGLTRLAHVMLGDAAAAEDVVQEAFCGLYRRWGGLADRGKALQSVRSAVLNGCRSALRQRLRLRHSQAGSWADAAAAMDGVPSAETAALHGEEGRALLSAVQRLPHRQREAVVLRSYLDLPEAEIAAVMGISGGSVRSAISRALPALGRLLENV
jgi:RNA polymerase sigma-70 factor (sigma-E family)